MTRATRLLQILSLSLSLLLAGAAPPAAGGQEATPAPSPVSAVDSESLFAAAVERTVALNGLATRVVEAGDPAARQTVILVNGGPGSSSDYLAGLFALASSDLRVVAYDQRGTGGTARPADGNYATPALVADLDALIAELGGGPVHLIGQSWGGFLAAVYTVTHPQRVASLALMGAMPLAPSPGIFAAGDTALNTRILELQGEGVIPNPIPAPARDDDCAEETAIAPAYEADPADAAGHIAAMPASTCSLTVFEQTYGGAVLFVTGRLYRDRVLPAARVWKGPLYVIFGEHDPFRSAWEEPVAAAFPNARLSTETVPDAGHHPWLDDPTLIDRLRAFIVESGVGSRNSEVRG